MHCMPQRGVGQHITAARRKMPRVAMSLAACSNGKSAWELEMQRLYLTLVSAGPGHFRLYGPMPATAL